MTATLQTQRLKINEKLKHKKRKIEYKNEEKLHGFNVSNVMLKLA